MRLYNTLTKKVEEFVSNEQGKVKMYTCGPTVYHYAHIGNLRTYIFEDILEKGLSYLGYDVQRAMNITDVGHLTSDGDTGEDKMAKGAAREGKTVYEIADFYTKAFLDDMVDLNIKVPSLIEKASDNIDVYIEMITKMIEKDYAYISNGNVYFDISKAPDYYQLSGKNQDDLLIGVRDTVEEDKSKRNPADFVLWFTLSKFENQVMKWDSPWGVGYPGWHIECSGISIKNLGEKLDIYSQLALDRGIALLLENDGLCNIDSINKMHQLLELYSFSNIFPLINMGVVVATEDDYKPQELQDLINNCQYFHITDYDSELKRNVVVGEGDIDYEEILSAKFGDICTIFSLEPHTKYSEDLQMTLNVFASYEE